MPDRTTPEAVAPIPTIDAGDTDPKPATPVAPINIELPAPVMNPDAATQVDEEPQYETQADPEAERQEKIKTQKKEIGSVNLSTILQKGRALAAMSEEDRTKKLSEDAGNIIFLNLCSFYDRKTPFEITDPNKSDITKFKPPIKIPIDGALATITNIVAFENGNFTCTYELKKNGSTRIDNITIDKQKLFDAQYLAGREILQGSAELKDSQKKLIGFELDSLEQGPAAIPDLGTDTADKAIKDAATDSGILTTADVKPLILANSSLEDQEKLLKALEGKTLLDFDTTAKILEKTGMGPQGIARETEAIKTKIGELQQKLAVNQDDQAAQDELKVAKQMLGVLKDIPKALEQNGALGKHFENIQKGDYSPEEARALAKALQSGNIEEAIGALSALADNPNESTEERERKAAERQKLLAVGKAFGFGALLILILASMAAIKTTQFALKQQ